MMMMTNNMRNKIIGTTIGISAIAGYSMYRYNRNARRPFNRAKNMLSKTTNMF